MESGRVYDNSHTTSVVLNNESLSSSTSKVLDSIWVADSSTIFQVSTSMVNFEDIRGGNSNGKTLFTQMDAKLETGGDEEFDKCFRQPEKKRRLLPNQVHFLEKSFDQENKLEPERKVELARELGLQPRQVAIWFQNRRARYKNKHIEKDYDILKASYDKLKEDYDTLYKENEKFKNEVQLLREKLTNGNPQIGELSDCVSPLDVQVNDAQPNSAKSDVFDDPDDSSHVFEPVNSDISQDEDNMSFLSLSRFPKLEVESFDDLQPNSCNLGFPVQDQGTWLWPY